MSLALSRRLLTDALSPSSVYQSTRALEIFAGLVEDSDDEDSDLDDFDDDEDLDVSQEEINPRPTKKAKA